MEDFVVELKNNIKDSSDFRKKNKSSRFHELLRLLSDSDSEFKLVEFKEDGDIVFEVSMKSLNISFETMRDYRQEICSSLMINTIGELVIREHLNEFAQLILNVAHEDYLTVVHGHNHTSFGMQLFRDKFIFTFHISLLQKILIEDVRKKIK